MNADILPAKASITIKLDDDRRDHDRQLIGHAYGGQNGVEGKDQIDQSDLHDGGPKTPVLLLLFLMTISRHFVISGCALPDQKYTARKE